MADKNNLAKKDSGLTTEQLDKKETAKAYAALVVTILTAIKLIFAAQFGVKIPQDIIDTAVNIILGAITVWSWFRNNYVTKRGKKQLHLLKNSKLE